MMTDSPTQPAQTRDPEAGYFGFKPIDPHAKTPLVRQLFSDVAGKYDLMNDLMSLGVHRLWKSELVARVRPRAGESLLDVAGGTGDIAFRLATAAPGASVTVCDLTQAMVQVGRDRGIDRGMANRIAWSVGNAEDLPFPDRSMDAYTIAFGLRNVTRIDRALAEARRVLKPGGRFFCMEFSQVALPILDRLYDHYSFQVLPWLGQKVAGDRDSYLYLAESIRRFPDRDSLCRRMEQAGLARPKAATLSGGIAAIHSGWRI